MIAKMLTTIVAVFACKVIIHKLYVDSFTLPPPGIDSKLQVYVDRFHDQLRARCGFATELPDMNIGMGNTSNVDPFNKNVVGWCVTYTKLPTVVIDTAYFEEATDLEREQLVFHELGHCILDREHVKTLNSDGTPKSIMYPSTLSDSIYRNKYRRYIDELFSEVDCSKYKGGGNFENEGVH